LRRSDDPVDRLAHDPKRLETILAGVRRQSYATRDPGLVGGSFGGSYGAAPRNDGLAAIAVALSDGTRVYGSINVLWIKAASIVDAFARAICRTRPERLPALGPSDKVGDLHDDLCRLM